MNIYPSARGRAAEAAHDAFDEAVFGPDAHSDPGSFGVSILGWHAVVDAVAAVLAAEDMGIALLTANEGFADAQMRIGRALGIPGRSYGVDQILDRIDEITSILESKNADLRTLIAQLDRATVAAHEARARVAELEEVEQLQLGRIQQLTAAHTDLKAHRPPAGIEARVVRFTEALTEIAKGSCDWQERAESNNCLEDFPGLPDNWCESCTAREALAAGSDTP